MARTGRPKKEIDTKMFENLCGLQCTKLEICDFLEVSDKTLDKWCKDQYGENYSVVYKKKRERGKISLRRAQFKLAETNASMAIFLGKQYLGQRDQLPNENPDGKNNLLEAIKGAGEINTDGLSEVE